MSPSEQSAAIYATAVTVLGYGFQWIFGLQKVPNWAVWVGLCAMSVLAFIWATPDFGVTDWRTNGLKLFTFVMAARGVGASAKQAKLAPATNSL